VDKLMMSSLCASAGLLFLQAGGNPSIDQMLAVASDQLAESLDAQKGCNVSDPGIFRAHAAKYEVGLAALSFQWLHIQWL
jgi:hypothetical protein